MEQASQSARWPDEQADPEVARFEDRTADSLGHVLSAVRAKRETDPAELPRERDKQGSARLVHCAQTGPPSGRGDAGGRGPGPEIGSPHAISAGAHEQGPS